MRVRRCELEEGFLDSALNSGAKLLTDSSLVLELLKFSRSGASERHQRWKKREGKEREMEEGREKMRQFVLVGLEFCGCWDC